MIAPPEKIEASNVPTSLRRARNLARGPRVPGQSERPSGVEVTIGAIAAAFLGGGACSSMECGSVGCPTPIVVSAQLADPSPGTYTATFCKDGTCESAEVEPFNAALVDIQKSFFVRFQTDPTAPGGGTVAFTASVLGAPSFHDGESLRLTVSRDSSPALLDWSATAAYTIEHDLNGPGCGDCYVLRATVPE